MTRKDTLQKTHFASPLVKDVMAALVEHEDTLKKGQFDQMGILLISFFPSDRTGIATMINNRGAIRARPGKRKQMRIGNPKATKKGKHKTPCDDCDDEMIPALSQARNDDDVLHYFSAGVGPDAGARAMKLWMAENTERTDIGTHPIPLSKQIWSEIQKIRAKEESKAAKIADEQHNTEVKQAVKMTGTPEEQEAQIDEAVTKANEDKAVHQEREEKEEEKNHNTFKRAAGSGHEGGVPQQQVPQQQGRRKRKKKTA